MHVWDSTQVTTDRGCIASAIAPVIVSASRSTDIPGCYARWFMHRFLEKKYIVWTNPFNQYQTFVSFQRARAIIFWTKNAQPIRPYLKSLENRGVDFYFQYTLNDYEDVGYEPGIPDLDERINDFKDLSTQIGKSRTIWRFDPLLLSDKVDIDSLIERVRTVGSAISQYTERLVLSFIDLECYRKLRKASQDIHLRELTVEEMTHVAEAISDMNHQWNLDLFTCAEDIPLDRFDIKKGSCVDGDLLLRLFPNNTELASFVMSHRKKDSGQRRSCGCIPSKDIGEYDTCPHLCRYCYANCSRGRVIKNLGNHNRNPLGDTITGRKIITDPCTLVPRPD